MDEDIVAILMGGLIVFTPIAGLTIRFALKPLVDAFARVIEMRATGYQTELAEKRLALLEQEVLLLRAEQTRLLEQQEFYERLSGPRN